MRVQAAHEGCILYAEKDTEFITTLKEQNYIKALVKCIFLASKLFAVTSPCVRKFPVFLTDRSTFPTAVYIVESNHGLLATPHVFSA
jgi:hypothetical protein